MKQLILFLTLLSMAFYSCEQSTPLTYEDVEASFYASNDSIKLVSYRMKRVDTFGQGGVWNNDGFAHLERDTSDTIFGFNFYGKRDDVPQISIYDQGKNFDLDMEELIYEISPGGYYFVGSPGGQMVSTSFFKLDEEYDSAWVEPMDSGYKLLYRYPDDSLYMVTERLKEIALNSEFLPTKLRVSSLNQGEKSSTTMYFSDIKINKATASSMEAYKQLIKDYTLLEPEEYVPSDYLGQPLPAMNLSNIQTGETAYFRTDKLLLIDFWEVWCGWCIKSFPEVEQLYQTYKEDLEVIGIATESKDKALQLIEEKEISFNNYFQDQEFIDKFNIRSWPTYILVDRNGIMIKEYFGFKEDIEADVKALINDEL